MDFESNNWWPYGDGDLDNHEQVAKDILVALQNSKHKALEGASLRDIAGQAVDLRYSVNTEAFSPLFDHKDGTSALFEDRNVQISREATAKGACMCLQRAVTEENLERRAIDIIMGIRFHLYHRVLDSILREQAEEQEAWEEPIDTSIPSTQQTNLGVFALLTCAIKEGYINVERLREESAFFECKKLCNMKELDLLHNEFRKYINAQLLHNRPEKIIRSCTPRLPISINVNSIRKLLAKAPDPNAFIADVRYSFIDVDDKLAEKTEEVVPGTFEDRLMPLELRIQRHSIQQNLIDFLDAVRGEIPIEYNIPERFRGLELEEIGSLLMTESELGRELTREEARREVRNNKAVEMAEQIYGVNAGIMLATRQTAVLNDKQRSKKAKDKGKDAKKRKEARKRRKRNRRK